MNRREKGSRKNNNRNSNYNALSEAAMELFGESLDNLSYAEREDAVIYSENLND
jgi:hypothetical protein